jgi:hypothetical protein
MSHGYIEDVAAMRRAEILRETEGDRLMARSRGETKLAADNTSLGVRQWIAAVGLRLQRRIPARQSPLPSRGQRAFDLTTVLADSPVSRGPACRD